MRIFKTCSTAGFGNAQIDAVNGPGEQTPHHRFEKVERRAVVGRVERGLVIQLAEARGVRIMRVTGKAVEHVAIHPEVMEEIIDLENAVIGAHPVKLLADEGAQDGGGDVGVVVAAQGVADVVEQGHDDIRLVLAAAMGARRGLQAVLEAVDREAAIIAVEQAQMGQHAVGEPAREGPEMLADRLPILCGSFVHAAEGGLGGVGHGAAPRCGV
jgi:hypothetical protein